MATPGELIQAVAEALGLPKATVIIHDRLLMDAGLRSKHGRGRGAAKVTPRDASHLLVAILGSGQVKDTVATVRRYGGARVDRKASSATQFGNVGIEELAVLSREHSFLDALEALVGAVANGSLSPSKSGLPVPDVIDIGAQTPGTVGNIRIAGTVTGATASVRYARPSPWDDQDEPDVSEAAIAAWDRERSESLPQIRLRQTREISAESIRVVAAALAADKEKD